MLKGLPAPGTAFALDLSIGEVTDVELKELAGFDHLTALNLWLAKVTDAGMKHLTGLKRLTTLSIGYGSVSEVGAKELAGMKQLTTLCLGFVTDAGAKELAAASRGSPHLTSGRVD